MLCETLSERNMNGVRVSLFAQHEATQKGKREIFLRGSEKAKV